MPTLASSVLCQVAQDIFVAAGVDTQEARVVAQSLAQANLMGHDSHGVMRIPEYVMSLEQGRITCGSHIKIVHESDAMAVMDGNWGFGQVIAREAMNVAIGKATAVGVAAVTLRHCCHIGRVGEYGEIATDRGMAAIIFVNVHGAGRVVAPWGGRERRLSANPIVMAVPRGEAGPLVMDISTCAIAEGKVRVARHRGQHVPEGCLIDSEGHPTTDPEDFYSSPLHELAKTFQGALLPFGGHKGFALSLLCDILAGVISGGGCCRPDAQRIGNAFLAIVIDIDQFRPRHEFEAAVQDLVAYVKSSAPAPGAEKIMVPGEPEREMRTRRERDGISIDDSTWQQIVETAERLGVEITEADILRG